MNLWLWEVCKHDGRSSPGTMKQPWKEAARQFLFSHPGSEWDEVGRGSAPDRLLPAEVVLQRNMPADLIYSWTGKVLWLIPHAQQVPVPSSTTSSQMHQMQFRLQEESPKKHNCPAFLRCVTSDIHRHTKRWTIIPAYFSNIRKSWDRARS